MRLAILIAMVFAAAALGQSRELVYEPPVPPPPPDASYLIIRLFILTGFVIALCIAIMWFAKRFQRTATPGTKAGELEYVYSLPLNGRCSLHLLNAAGHQVVVGTDHSGIKSLLVVDNSFAMALKEAEKADLNEFEEHVNRLASK